MQLAEQRTRNCCPWPRTSYSNFGETKAEHCSYMERPTPLTRIKIDVGTWLLFEETELRLEASRFQCGCAAFCGFVFRMQLAGFVFRKRLDSNS